MANISRYTPEVVEEILVRISGGESLTSVCRDDHMPEISTVMRWVIYDKHPEFKEAYIKAREANALAHGDRVISIAEQGLSGELNEKAGRVAMQAFMWNAERCAHGTYGPKGQMALTGKDGGAIEVIDNRDLSRRVAFLLTQAADAELA